MTLFFYSHFHCKKPIINFWFCWSHPSDFIYHFIIFHIRFGPEAEINKTEKLL
jgi:hypothetical protein